MISETSTWPEEEFASLNLGDKRLNERAISMVQQCAGNPTASFPKTFNGSAEVTAAYRLFDNEKVTVEKFLAPHWGCAEQRAKSHPVVLALQDTTELNYNGQQIDGMGPLSYAAQRGMYLHVTLLTTTERESLGVVDCWMWAREIKEPAKKSCEASAVKTGKKTTKTQAAQTKSPNEAGTGDVKLLTEKESVRWIEGYERVADMAERLPDTRVVYVADREGDILDLMKCAHARNCPADWLVRAKHNRNLQEGEKLWDCVNKTDALGGIRFTMAARKGVKARPITQEIRIKQVMLPGGKAGDIAVTCIIATEVDTPPDVEPVCWRLLTNRQVTTLEEAIELIEWYRARWEIEIFFHVLKNGCAVEKMQLDSFEKVERALAIYLVVAWRIMHLMRMGRTCPELPADLFFDADEIRVAYLLTRNKPPPERPPQINEVLRLIAQIGGFLARKGDGEPGVQTIWRGMQDVRVSVITIQILREEDLAAVQSVGKKRKKGTCV